MSRSRADQGAHTWLRSLVMSEGGEVAFGCSVQTSTNALSGFVRLHRRTVRFLVGSVARPIAPRIARAAPELPTRISSSARGPADHS